MSITQQELMEALKYDKASGLFVWNRPTNRRIKVGATAGSVNLGGYIQIRINGKIYLAHRLAWLYINGDLPSLGLDHINGIKDDNRIANLRQATDELNNENVRTPRKRVTSTPLGVTPWNGRFKASMTHKKKSVYIGMFNTEQEAHAAYVQQKRELHKGCTL